MSPAHHTTPHHITPHHTTPHRIAAEDYDEEDEPQQQPGGFQKQRGPPQNPQYEEDEDEYYEDTPEEPLPQMLSLEISPDECSAYVCLPTTPADAIWTCVHQHGHKSRERIDLARKR